MLKHYINIIDNTYIIEKDDVIIFSVELDNTLDQIVVRTPNEVYAGPVDLICFSADVAKK